MHDTQGNSKPISSTRPNYHSPFPYTLPWQHQNNESLKAKSCSNILLQYPEASEILTRFHRRAHAAPILTITDASITPPSGDKRDFMSYAPYWWPNSTDPHGQWVQRDGLINPDTAQLTQQADLTAAINIMRIEALAELFLGPSTYGMNHVVHQLRAWFINPATRMNPNAMYGQIVRNENPSTWIGRYEAILSVRQLAFVPSLVELARTHSALWRDQQEDVVMTQWAQDYLAWLLDPPFKAGTNTNKNNHRTYWTCQVVEYQRLLGKHADAATTLTTFSEVYLPLQIDPNGRQSLETHRTRPIHYALFNLDALVYLASFAEQVRPDTDKPYGDLWDAQNHAIKKALDLLIHHHAPKDIEPQDVDTFHRLVQVISCKYGDRDGVYSRFLKGIGPYQKAPYQLSPLFSVHRI
ncbi:alginate lyase-domain-containing protein [Piptocephalis cylindrospora]|uniref:Alginate lyase-domain-containing protein n=1 Tax=Piptocephalis cylindrospora TaxID=1907219 RepID=A0A4V1IYA2_9FUNG|nr:alginate lyase-domain-containing protein [Piptocephalis cylindrospora]|eukprot:RKP13849.1 alginate lyase-domain-containing protein [Piptocephalis cylindrospora]